MGSLAQDFCLGNLGGGVWASHGLLWAAAPKLPVTTGSGGLTVAPLPTCLLLGPREPKQLRVMDWEDLTDPTIPRE